MFPSGKKKGGLDVKCKLASVLRNSDCVTRCGGLFRRCQLAVM